MDKDDAAAAMFGRRFLAYFAVGLTIAGMAYLAAITFAPIPPANIRFADTILGFIIGTLVASPVGFYFGSSKSSQASSEVLRSMLPAKPIQADAEQAPQ
jgi:hypothetical protein